MDIKSLPLFTSVLKDNKISEAPRHSFSGSFNSACKLLWWIVFPSHLCPIADNEVLETQECLKHKKADVSHLKG